MVRLKSSEDGANLRNKTIRCINLPELLILIKIFQPYRITVKRILWRIPEHQIRKADLLLKARSDSTSSLTMCMNGL